ncbi:MAG TPA: cytochrome c-type biogenesis protein [Gemmatimonadaceae bacterium]|nr:cytochrome c-type biogenesis protein [Gemmatimonadaceae bacterium]
MRRLLSGVVVALALVTYCSAPAAAQSDAQSAAQSAAPPSAAAPLSTAAESTLDANTRAVASQLRCPVCQGLSLQDSPSELAQQMRTLVREQLAEGKSQDEVKQYFVTRYGEWILMAPEKHGFNWVVYFLPFLVLIGGAWVLIVALKRWTAADPSDQKASQSGGTRTVL